MAEQADARDRAIVIVVAGLAKTKVVAGLAGSAISAVLAEHAALVRGHVAELIRTASYRLAAFCAGV